MSTMNGALGEGWGSGRPRSESQLPQPTLLHWASSDLGKHLLTSVSLGGKHASPACFFTVMHEARSEGTGILKC